MPKESTSSKASKFHDSPINSRLRKHINSGNILGLSKKLGVTEAAIRQWQGGYTRPELDKVVAIAEFLGVSCDYLLGRTDIESPNPDLQAAVEFTGLSEEAVRLLSGFSRDLRKYLAHADDGYNFSQFPEKGTPEFEEYVERERTDDLGCMARGVLELVSAFVCDCDLHAIVIHAEHAKLIAGFQISNLKIAADSLEAVKSIIVSGGEFTEEILDKVNRYCRFRRNEDNTITILPEQYDAKREDDLLLYEYKSQRLFAGFMERYSGLNMQAFDELKRRMWQLRDECKTREIELVIKDAKE